MKKLRFSLRIRIVKSVCDILYNNQMNARALIGQSATIYRARKLMETSRVL